MQGFAFIATLALAACSSAVDPHVLREPSASAPPDTQTCNSVTSLRLNAPQCLDRSVQIEADLIAEHHGNWISDGRGAIRIQFSDTNGGRNPLSDKLIEAHLGHPFGRLHGVFEGILTTEPGSEKLVFIVDREIQ